MKITIKELNITTQDIEKSENLDELKMLKIKLDFLIGRFSNQLEEYKLQYIEEGVSGDYDWLRRVKCKKRLYGTVSQLLQHKIGVLGKKEKEVRRNSATEILIEKIKQNMDKDLFYKLVDEAHREADNYKK